ncbi:metallophosphoesterase [Alteriqipengyuania sp. WL0013]|uniref:metallophosphoesterase n=1 Tax=Alteriqipengyuania sp. WL0013 TaxID=3110773 RepID=UPI002BE114D0|nr:metallophosphoesterase [Alteriqipengyuania sp. WL0013]MEB3416821.1 metallophosphoesterase [Alteriqipengyuania sp. WL0013]
MSVKYLVMSDLHLGAKESLLTHADEEGNILPDPSPTLAAFGKAMRATFEAMEIDEGGVQLVLLGDVLDLGLSPFGKVSHSFLQFLDVLQPEGAAKVFAPDIVYIPGNHDHHMWRMTQDQQFVTELERSGHANAGDPKQRMDDDDSIHRDILHTTRLTAYPDLPCRMLCALMQRHAYFREGRSRIAYPNWAIVSDDGNRAVAMHHGHYIDSMYRSLSNLRGWLTGDKMRPDTMLELEQQNGPWIDFLWSDLGSAGLIGAGADTLYETLLDAGASHAFAQTMARRITDALRAKTGIQPTTELKFGVTVKEMVQAAVDLTAGRGAEQQRDGYRSVMTPSEVDDLRWYIGTPLANQFAASPTGIVPDGLSFIFGHTHKPFQDQLAIDRYAHPVSVFNTGGWVLDQPTLMPAQGTAAILIDDDLNVTSLRLLNDVINDTLVPIHAAQAGGRGPRGAILQAAAAKAVAATAPAWAEFSDAARARIEKLAEERVSHFMDEEDARSVDALEALS